MTQIFSFTINVGSVLSKKLGINKSYASNTETTGSDVFAENFFQL